MTFTRLLILGCGYTGLRALRQAAGRDLEVLASVRSEARRKELQAEPARLLFAPVLDASIAEHVDARTHVLVAFQPDDTTDSAVAPALAGAHSVTYISSTGVYGALRGRIDDATPLPEAETMRAARILRAEQRYRAVGATVLRAAAIYGPDRGLHVRVLRGEHKLPGDGSQMLSRIHVHDLAAFALASAAVRGETFVVADAAPAPHAEVVRFICKTYGCPAPEAVPLERVHASLQSDRAIDSSRAQALLGVRLRYPSYRQGMAPEATGIAPLAHAALP